MLFGIAGIVALAFLVLFLVFVPVMSPPACNTSTSNGIDPGGPPCLWYGTFDSVSVYYFHFGGLMNNSEYTVLW